MGHSSGAHLSLLVATDPKYLAEHKLSAADIAGVVGLSAPVDLVPREVKKGSATLSWPARARTCFRGT